MVRRSNGMSWTKCCSVWLLALILLSSGISIDAAKSKKQPSRGSGGSSGRAPKPQPNYHATSLSYAPNERIPSPQQSRPVQSAPAAPVQHAPPPYSAHPAPPPYSAHPAPSAPEIPKSNPPAAGWNVGEQRPSVNTVNNAPPPYVQGPPPPYSPHAQPAYPGGGQPNYQGQQPSFHGPPPPYQQPQPGYAPQPQPGGYAPQPHPNYPNQQTGNAPQPVINNYYQQQPQDSKGSGIGTALLAAGGGLAGGALLGAALSRPSEEKTIIIHQGEATAAPVAPVAAAPAPAAPVVPAAPVAPAAVPAYPAAVPAAPVESAPTPVPAIPGPFSPMPESMSQVPPTTNSTSPDASAPLAPLEPLPVAADNASLSAPLAPLAPLPVVANPCQPDQNGMVPVSCITPSSLAITAAPPLIHSSASESSQPPQLNADLTAMAGNSTNTTNPGRNAATTICVLHVSIYSALALIIAKFL